MTIEMTDELELTSKTISLEKENEISSIIKLFQFSNLNLIISNEKGEIFYGSNSFSSLSGFFVKELTRKNLDQVLNKKFDAFEIAEIEKESECYNAMRILKTKSGKEIGVTTYNSLLREFLSLYIVTILVPSPAM
ncbi:MAG: hypothetical protein KBA66_08650 [Leptospiraceae bacterium]|nr:hypothetical protein [Leptospiraceae bacterium]